MAQARVVALALAGASLLAKLLLALALDLALALAFAFAFALAFVGGSLLAIRSAQRCLCPSAPASSLHSSFDALRVGLRTGA
jgi:hypothetical protein